MGAFPPASSFIHHKLICVSDTVLSVKTKHTVFAAAAILYILQGDTETFMLTDLGRQVTKKSIPKDWDLW